MLDFLHELIRQQIEAFTEGIRFVFVQPAYVPQHELLLMFLKEPNCLYVRLEGHNIDDVILDQTVQQSLGEQFPNGKWENVRILILDECDRAQDQALETLLSSLMPIESLRILLLSRNIPDFVLNNTRLHPYIAVVPNDATLMFPDYTVKQSRSNLLEVRALGRGHVLLNGKPVTDWDGELPHDLFFFLVDKGMTTRAQIFETFWPDLPLHEATNVFHVTKRKINEVLGIDLTQYAGGFYRIRSDIDLSYDVSLFGEMIQRSAVEQTQTSQWLLMRAIWLYKGDFLSSIQAQGQLWVSQRRHELNQQYSDALFAQAKLLEKSGDISAALGLYIRASTINRQREDLAGTIMRLYRDLGMYQDALDTYNRIETDILESVGISPARWLQDLAANIATQAKTAPSHITKES